MSDEPKRSLRVAGLFAGIGGLELGLDRGGHTTEFLCEIDPSAREVLAQRFPHSELVDDVRSIKRLPPVDLVTAGFPCQDLSLAGTQAGLEGARSGLVNEVFRLIRPSPPEFVVLENVLYLVKRQRGALIKYVTDTLSEMGYRWAYRVVDTRGFGIPQRRQRVIILASLGDVDPAAVLFDAVATPTVDDRIVDVQPGHHYGFYWTEGKRAVGWAPDAVPTIKGGSGLGIPSPPAIFDVDADLTGTPTVADGERLQGFEAGWTDVKENGNRLREGRRWTLIGNAVSVPVSEWLGCALAAPQQGLHDDGEEVVSGRPMPMRAAGDRHGMVGFAPTLHVAADSPVPIGDFLSEPLKPLSTRAIRGFVSRVDAGVMNLPDGLMHSLERQARRQG